MISGRGRTASRIRTWSVPVVAVVAMTAIVQGQRETRFDLLTAGIEEIQAAVGAGALTYERLTQLYLNRIEAYDKHGPKLNAVIAVQPRALAIARALDEERRRSGLRSPLHGIPIAVKDNLDVADLPSAGGNLALAGTFPPRDATVIRRLRDAGAIILMKTNMDELALGSRGFSSLGGQTLNPYDLRRNPGGSSGGTGVAVTAAFAAAGLATETGVSIRSPASNNAVVGIAPTRGLVSRAGVIPISFTQDRVGPHARSVADAALLLTYMRGVDVDDLLTLESLGHAEPAPYTEGLRGTGLSGRRIGVLRDLFRSGPEFEPGNALIDAQIAVLRQQGADVVDGLATGMDLLTMLATLRVNQYELRPALDSYLARRGPTSPVKSVEELAASGKNPDSLVRRLRESLKRPPLDFDAEYRARLGTQVRVRQVLIELMERHGVDALVYPFKSLGAPVVGESDSGTRDNPVSSTTGLPAIVVPAGVTGDGLPLALEILGRPFSERLLVGIAYGYEQATKRRVPPSSTPHLAGEVFAY